MDMRTTSEKITELQPYEYFVFGSNLSGWHGGGAAKLAYEKFGAIYGNGIGLQGQSYAIPTKSEGIKRSLTVSEIQPYVNLFIGYAMQNPDMLFLVTEIGCGIAGNSVEDIAPLFKHATMVPNIHLPERFWKVLN